MKAEKIKGHKLKCFLNPSQFLCYVIVFCDHYLPNSKLDEFIGGKLRRHWGPGRVYEALACSATPELTEQMLEATEPGYNHVTIFRTHREECWIDASLANPDVKALLGKQLAFTALPVEVQKAAVDYLDEKLKESKRKAKRKQIAKQSLSKIQANGLFTAGTDLYQPS